MNEETIYDQNTVGEEKQDNKALNNDETTIDETGKTPVLEETPNEKKKRGYKMGGIAGAAGLAGAGLMLTVSKLFPESLDAIGDFGGSESDSAPTPSSNLQGHDMPIATGVNDSMSFSQAFAAARQEVGPGGIFAWHGQSYGTYYANEWNAMTQEEQDQYWADVYHTTSHIEYEPTSEPEPQPEPDPNQELDDQRPSEINEGKSEGDENLTEPQPHTKPDEGEDIADNGEGESLIEEPEPPVKPEEVSVEGGEEQVVEPDMDDEPILVVDPLVDENGEIPVADGQEIEGTEVMVEGIDDDMDSGEEILDPSMENMDDGFVADNPDVDDFASLTPDPDVTIDNNLDMSDFS